MNHSHQANRRRVANAAGAVVLLASIPAAATNDVDAIVAQATSDFAAGRYEQAQHQVNHLLSSPGQPPLQALFLAGHLAGVRGDCDAAEKHFRRMLARDGSLARPRIDLGLALARCGKPHQAVAELKQALDAKDMHRPVEEQVINLIRGIRSEAGWIDIGAGVVRDSNPTGRTTNSETTIRGLRYTLDSEARARSSTGVAFTLDARLPLDAQWRLYGAGTLARVEHPGHTFDIGHARAVLGTRHPFDQGEQTLFAELGLHAAAYQDRELYSGVAARFEHRWKLVGVDVLVLELDYRALDYKHFDHLDGHQTTIAASVEKSVAPNTRVYGSVGVTLTRTREAAYSNRSASVVIGVQHEFNQGWITSGRLEHTQRRHRAHDPLFGTLRDDETTAVEAAVSHRRLRFAGFRPKVVVGASINDSTIPYFGHRRRYVRLAVERMF